MNKKYYLSWSAIFNMIPRHNGKTKPWVVKCEGSKDTWIFETEDEAREWIANQSDGELAGFSDSEKAIWNKYNKNHIAL